MSDNLQPDYKYVSAASHHITLHFNTRLTNKHSSARMRKIINGNSEVICIKSPNLLSVLMRLFCFTYQL